MSRPPTVDVTSGVNDVVVVVVVGVGVYLVVTVVVGNVDDVNVSLVVDVVVVVVDGACVFLMVDVVVVYICDVDASLVGDVVVVNVYDVDASLVGDVVVVVVVGASQLTSLSFACATSMSPSWSWVTSLSSSQYLPLAEPLPQMPSTVCSGVVVCRWGVVLCRVHWRGCAAR